MKIIITDKKTLLDSLNRVQGVVEKKNTLQILSNIYLNAANDSLIIKATDLEVSIETSIPVKVLEPGKATISAKSFYEIIRELPEKEIQIQSKDNHWIGINCGKSSFNIMGLSPEDFPSLPVFSNKNIQKARVDVLRNMIDHTIYAVSTDETRYNFNGVYLEPGEKGKFRMVATDGHRLAFYEDVLFEGNPQTFSKGVIIPKKGIQEVRKIIENSGPTIDFAAEGNHLLVKAGTTFLSIRMIEGQFPDYRQVIPRNNNKILELDRSAFLNSLRRVSLLANEKSKGVKLIVTADKMEISSNNPDLGEASDHIEVSYKGDHVETGFNARYLQEALAVIPEEVVHFELNDRMSPGLIRVPGKEQYLSVLMPMRL